tara:strand:- start:269 stop:463 length:195 start_codon:yes stop_codon:yes gene_type:complete
MTNPLGEDKIAGAIFANIARIQPVHDAARKYRKVYLNPNYEKKLKNVTPKKYVQLTFNFDGEQT